jgi:hypothetical protein
MAETTADVRRDIELTRNRISDTLEQLEHKLNITQLVRDNPWPSLALAVGAGVLLSGSRADVKAAAATVTATKGASGRIGTVLDDLVSQVVQTFHGAIEQRIEGLATQLKQAIGAPTTPRNVVGNGAPSNPSFGFNQPSSGDGMSAPRAD